MVYRDRVKRRVVTTAVVVLAVVGAALFGFHAFTFKDAFILVTVEESSSSAMAALPIGWERLPGAFIDCESKSVELEKRPPLFGVSLGVHCVSSSQGIEFRESTRFSVVGKCSVPLSEPASVQGRDWSGNTVEMVDNDARILRGDLVIEKTGSSGVVRFRYGDKRFSLAPGQSWAEILVFKDGTAREIDSESWENDLNECFSSGLPVTRLAVANRGFWPKSGVREFHRAEGGAGN